MANIIERGDKYLVKWRDPVNLGGGHRTLTFNRKRAAEEHKALVEDLGRQGKRWESPLAESRQRDAGPSVGDLMIAHLAWMKAKRQPGTLKNNVTMWRLFERFVGDVAKQALEDVPITWLSKARVEQFYDWCRDTPGRHNRPRHLDVIAKYTGLLQNAWKWGANRDEFIGAIPPPRAIDAGDMPHDAKNPTKAPTWEQMDAAIAAAALATAHGKPLSCWSAMPMAVMRALGVRVSQALGLRVGDFRAAEGGLELYFPGHLGKSKQERGGRIVPVSPVAVELVTKLIGTRGADEFLVPPRAQRGKRERVLRTETVCEAWRRAGVPEDVWRQRPDHAFRKGFTTCLTESGADDKAVEFLVGHSMGLQGVYRASRGYPLEEAVALMPPFSPEAWAAIEKAIAESAGASTNATQQREAAGALAEEEGVR